MAVRPLRPRWRKKGLGLRTGSLSTHRGSVATLSIVIIPETVASPFLPQTFQGPHLHKAFNSRPLFLPRFRTSQMSRLRGSTELASPFTHGDPPLAAGTRSRITVDPGRPAALSPTPRRFVQDPYLKKLRVNVYRPAPKVPWPAPSPILQRFNLTTHPLLRLSMTASIP